MNLITEDMHKKLKQTREEKIALYMKLEKEKIAEMLAEANIHLDYYTGRVGEVKFSMNTYRDKLREQFYKESGYRAVSHSCGPSIGYVKWLESKLTQSNEHREGGIIANSVGCDLYKNTWTFEVPPDTKRRTGKFYITPVVSPPLTEPVTDEELVEEFIFMVGFLENMEEVRMKTEGKGVLSDIGHEWLAKWKSIVNRLQSKLQKGESDKNKKEDVNENLRKVIERQQREIEDLKKKRLSFRDITDYIDGSNELDDSGKQYSRLAVRFAFNDLTEPPTP